MKGEIVKSRYTITHDYITDEIEIVKRLFTTISQTPQSLQQGIVKRLFTILRAESNTKVLLRLCETQVDTRYVLSKELGLSKRSTYNALEALIGLGLVFNARPLSLGVPKRRGPKPALFAIIGYENSCDAIARAVERDRLARTPAYAEVKRITQLLLDDYFSKITRGEIWGNRVYKRVMYPIVKKECRGVRWFDLVPMVERELRKIGLEVI